MTITPIHDFIVVEKKASETKTASGLVLTAPTDEKMVQQEVFACGPGRLSDSGSLVPLSVKVGDKIVFSKSSAVEMKVEDKLYWVLREDAVICVLK